MCADAVHAVCGRADEDAVARGDAERAEEGVDGFVAADACEEVGGCEGSRGVRVCVAEVAEELLEVVLVAAIVLSVYYIGKIIIVRSRRTGIGVRED